MILMNGAHWHLIVNHIPLIFPIGGILILITGLIYQSEVAKRLAYFLFILGSLACLPAMNTGEAAEEVIESIKEIDEIYVERHEESAETFAILSYLLGAFSAAGLWISIKRTELSGKISIAIMIYAIIVAYFGKQTGTSGGEIRHSEIRESRVPFTHQTMKEEAED